MTHPAPTYLRISSYLTVNIKQDAAVARLVYVARLRDKVLTPEDLRLYHINLLNKLGPRRPHVTGLLVVYPTCLLHVLEAPHPVIVDLLKELHATYESGTVMTSVRVASAREGIKSRSFKQWRVAYVDGYGAPDTADAVDPGQVVQTLWDLTLKMILVGDQLSKIAGEEKIETALKSLHTFATDIPRPELVMSVAVLEDAPTLAEYIEIYDAPLNLDVESELVWPVGMAYVGSADNDRGEMKAK
jgi:hypothetical protein